MSLDISAAATEDGLLESLTFHGGRPAASYISRRESVTLFPSGSNVYSPTGTRVLRVPLISDGWIDPSTIALQFTLNYATASVDETPADHLYRCRPVGGPRVFWSRGMIHAQGQQAEDIQQFGRIYEMLQNLTPLEYQKNAAAMGFGCREPNPVTWDDVHRVRGLAPGTSKTVTMPLSVFGLFSQPKFLWGKMMGLVLQLEIADAASPCWAGNANENGKTVNFETSWNISDVQLHFDELTLDSQVQNELNGVVLSGRTIPVPYATYVTQVSGLAPNEDSPSIAINRAVSRLKSIFVTLGADRDDHRSDTVFFPHPMPDVALAPARDAEITFQAQIGSQNYPLFPIRTAGEAYRQLKKALGLHSSTFHTLGASAQNYRDGAFVIGVDTEKALQAAYTGANLRAGQTLVCRLGALTQNGGAIRAITKVYTTMMIDAALVIREGGVQVED